MDRKWVYSNGLQSVTLDQLVQQWLSTSSTSKNPVAAQSMMLDLSAGLWCVLESRRSGSNASEEIDFLARQEQAGKMRKLSFSVFFIPAAGLAHIKGKSFHLKKSGLKVFSSIRVFVNPRCSLTTKNTHHSYHL